MNQPQADREPLLSVRNFTKTFGPVQAVSGVSLDVFPQEVVGIIGDNGAGKSTFLSLLTGYNRPDSGEILYRGKSVAVHSPQTARNKLKIEMVYQRLELASDLTVWENLFLGEEVCRFGLITMRSEMKKRADKVLRDLNTKIKSTDIVGELSGGEQQTVAIGRALLFERETIIMDEPTAAISVQKVDDVLDTIRQLRTTGKTVLLVSHRLEDLIAVCDRIVIFYKGAIRCVLPAKNLTVNDLVHEMF